MPWFENLIGIDEVNGRIIDGQQKEAKLHTLKPYPSTRYGDQLRKAVGGSKQPEQNQVLGW
jgi:hypothetical protein